MDAYINKTKVRGLKHTVYAFLAGLRGKQRAGFVFLLGAVAALSMAPVHFTPALILSFSGFCLILNHAILNKSGRTKFKQSAWLGWCFGFGFFLAGLWWIGAAALVEADQFAWALPFAVLVFPAALALFWAFAAAGSTIFWHSNVQKIIGLSFFFTLAEFLRGHILTGFPWNAIGYGMMPTPIFMQSASVVGLWGVTLAAVFISTAPALFLLPANRKPQQGRALLVLAALLLFTHIGFGSWRLSQNAHLTTSDSPVMLRLVQPNISQEDKWRQGNEDAVFQSYLDLSAKPGLEKIDAVIWPESAFPFLIMQNPDALSKIDALLPTGTTLLTGAVRVKPPERIFSDKPPKLKFYNSLLAFDHQARRQRFYDKQRLVPFGEFMPFGETLEELGITNFVNIPGGFANGSEPNLMILEHPNPINSKLPPVSVLICYEAIFSGSIDTHYPNPEHLYEHQRRAKWLLNVTNDAWFGNLAGPYQHFHQATLRTVEEGLPMVRVANTGISATIDPFGRTLNAIPLGKAGIIDTSLPAALQSTLYARFKDKPFAIIMAFLCAMLVLGVARKRSEFTSANQAS